jgi:hypothetical protein
MNDLTRPPAGRATAPREAVARLADFAGEVDGLKSAFTDPIHLAALRQAVDLMHDVAIAHDDAGGYGVYAQDDEPEADAIDAFLAEWRAKKAAENRARLAASEVTP